MSHKRAQVTMFFVLGVVLLIVAGLVISSGRQKMQEVSKSEISLEPINQYVQSCLKDTIEEGIYFISSQGGYNHPVHAQAFEDRNVALYLDGRSFSVPTLYAIEDELAKYVELHLPECVDDFRGFTAAGYEIEASAPNSQTRVGENDITAFVTYPIIVSQGNSKAEIDEFSVSVPFDFKDVYKIVQDVMLQQGDDPLAVHYGFLAESAYYNGYYFYIIQMDDPNTIVYQLRFDSKTLNNEPYQYNFAIHYDWAGESANE